MAYVIRIDADLSDYVRGTDEFSTNIPQSVGRPEMAYPHLCFVFGPVPSAGARVRMLTHLGVVFQRGNRTSSFERRLAVNQVRAVDPPVPAEELRAYLSKSHADRLDAAAARAGTLTEAGVEAVLGALLALRPQLRTVIEWLRNLRNPARFITSVRGESYQLQREGVNTALAIAGLPVARTRPWEMPGRYQPYLAGIKAEPNESHLIDHDAKLFPDWQREPCGEVHVHVFRDGDQHVEVMNVNADSDIENKTGADLIYYHVATRSFIAVQYKCMDDNNFTYVDDRLRDQLDRLDGLKQKGRSPAVPDEWRLTGDSCFLKLVKKQPMDPYANELIAGLYLPVSYTRLLLQDPATVTQRGGNRLGYDTVQRYLTNTLFLELAREGWIGTSGVDRADLLEAGKESVRAGRSFVYAEDRSKVTARERQKLARSRTSKQARAEENQLTLGF